MAYESQHSLRDGAVLVYQRSQGVRGLYQARIRVPGESDYVVKSLKTSSLSEALRRAEDLYDELKYAKKQGIDVHAAELRFKGLWQRFYKAQKISLSVHRQRLHQGNAERYFVPFLGEYKVRDLPDMAVERYWEFRINFYASLAQEGGKKPPPNAAQSPAQKTLEMEASMLRQIFRWGKRMGFVKREPWIKSPKVKHEKGVTRRPTFSSEEWKKVYTHLRKWAAEPVVIERSKAGGSLHRRGPHALHRFQREMLRNYVLFMSNSGLRPNEARQLRWRDIRLEQNATENPYLIVEVAPTTKTGARTVVCREGAEKYIDRIRALKLEQTENDLVFSDRDGTPIESFNKTFMKVLQDIDLLTDRWGARRTVYSLRHFYCTQMLLDDQASILVVAQNMGTSISHIQKHYSHVFTLQKADELSRKSVRSRKLKREIEA
jgi:integrase